MDRTALSPLLRSFERHLRAANRSERTIASYLESLRQAEAFLAACGKGLADARRADLEAFLGDLLTRRAAGTVATRYKVLRILYGWLEEEDEIAANPMARVKPPIVPEQPIPVVPEDGLRRLLATCEGKSFEERRDTALILLLVDVGPRRAELMGAKVADLDFDLDVLLVLGKGRRERALLLAIGHPEALSDPEPVDAVVVDGPAGLLRLDSRPPPAPTGRHLEKSRRTANVCLRGEGGARTSDRTEASVVSVGEHTPLSPAAASGSLHTGSNHG
jgi:site-specific recombinase XerC